LALRALQHLNSMAGQIKIVTLATPFLRVFARRSLRLPALVQMLVFGAILSPGELAGLDIAHMISQDSLATEIVTIVLAMVPAFFVTRWLIAVFTNSQAALAIEEEAHYDTKGMAALHMLVIRGVDDEASLSLAAGSIGSRLSYLVLIGVIPAIYVISFVGLIFAGPALLFLFPQTESLSWFDPTLSIIESAFLGAAVCSPIFLILPSLFKSIFFGREFLLHALVCDIAVDSVPDTSGQVEATTLKSVEAASSQSEWISFIFGLETKWPYRSSERLFSLRWWSDMVRIWWKGWRTGEFLKPGHYFRVRKSFGLLRHGIYNHPHCVGEIVRWLRA
jgi:hypothetical protein